MDVAAHSEVDAARKRAQRLLAVDVSALHVRPGADPVERLRVVARAARVTNPTAAAALAFLPELRAFVLTGTVS